jgi:hypothetical protein
MRFGYRVLLAAFVLSLAPQAAVASSCIKPVTQRIVFGKGAPCWTYSGKATHFVGRFSAGQKLAVKMSGELLSYNEKTKVNEKTWEPRLPSVDGPQDFFAEGDFDKNDGTLELTVPHDGVYRFGFYPCVMWHNTGKVQICVVPSSERPAN